MIKNLIEFASELDEKGLHLEASRIDEVIVKMATGEWDLQIEDDPDFAAAEAEYEHKDQLNSLAPLAKALVLGATPIRGTNEEGEADLNDAIRELSEKMLAEGLFDAGIKIFGLLNSIGAPESVEEEPKPEPPPEDNIPF